MPSTNHSLKVDKTKEEHKNNGICYGYGSLEACFGRGRQAAGLFCFHLGHVLGDKESPGGKPS